MIIIQSFHFLSIFELNDLKIKNSVWIRAFGYQKATNTIQGVLWCISFGNQSNLKEIEKLNSTILFEYFKYG